MTRLERAFIMFTERHGAAAGGPYVSEGWMVPEAMSMLLAGTGLEPEEVERLAEEVAPAIVKLGTQAPMNAHAMAAATLMAGIAVGALYAYLDEEGEDDHQEKTG